MTLTYQQASARGRKHRQAGFSFRQSWYCVPCRAHRYSALPNWVALVCACTVCRTKTHIGEHGCDIHLIDDVQFNIPQGRKPK